MNITVLVPIIVFVVVILAAILIYLSILSKAKSRALKARIDIDDRGDSKQVDGESGFIKRSLTTVSDLSAKYVVTKETENVSNLRKSLISIGYRNKNAVIIFTQIRIVCILLPLVSLFILNTFLVLNLPSQKLLVYGICLALIGYSFPTLWLMRKTSKRKERLLNGFPDAVDMLVVCVEAGMGMDAAIERVGREIAFENEALSDELILYNKEVRVGKTRGKALKDLALRTGLDDMRALATLLIQTDKFGTSVAKALKTHSEFLRVQRYQRAEERAAKLTVKLVIPLIFCMFPAVFIVILGPAIINAIRINQ